MSEQYHDCLIIGGGPAGLTAAIYLARFHLSIKVIDAGASRAKWIPCSRNHAGFPDGISGEDLLDRMREQARKYGASIVTGRATRLDLVDGEFIAETGCGQMRACTVLLATGVTNRRPQMDEQDHERALTLGLIRYCPVCDGYEITDSNVGVIGSGGRAVAEAVFLRSYTEHVTIIDPHVAHQLSREDKAQVAACGIRLVDGPCLGITPKGNAIDVETASGRHAFDTLYPALGSDTHVELARQIGANIAEDGTLPVDSHQRTNVPGFYAAGDVVLGLDQISHAMGEGGVAATAIRNDLARDQPILRQSPGRTDMKLRHGG